jgi:hypothetical protein
VLAVKEALMLLLFIASLVGFAGCVLWVAILLERKAANEPQYIAARERFYRRQAEWDGRIHWE